MQYLLQIFVGLGQQLVERAERVEQQAITDEYCALRDEPGFVAGAQLQPADTATTVRVENGRTLTTDGPFVGEPRGARRLLPVRGRRPRRGARARRAHPGGPHGRRRRGARAGRVLIEDVFREHWGRVLAALIGFLGDFDLAEEAAQEAFARAAERWPRDGMPASPAAWLIAVGRNAALDRIRRERVLDAQDPAARPPARPPRTPWMTDAFPDERLELIFTCCHPALSLDAQVALTLRTLGGLTTTEIAQAFLVEESTMAQRLVRAKRKIAARGHPVPRAGARAAARAAAAVLAVFYLIYNEGYGGRHDLADESIRLSLALTTLMPDEPEAHGLLALMLLHDARRAARLQGDELVLLEDQDRALWDHAKIVAGRRALDRAIALRGQGPYVLQAAIASLHLAEPVDWPQIAGLYTELARSTGSPVVELNRAIAIAHVEGAERGLELIDALPLDGYRYLHSTRAELLRRSGRIDEVA